MPITGLSLAGVVYFIMKWTHNWYRRILLVVAMGAAFFGLQALPLPKGIALSLEYLITALTIGVPVVGYLYKTDWHNRQYVLLAFGIFGLAVLFRFLDKRLELEFFWMGTHWLWHLLGGLAVYFLIKYIYEDNAIRPAGNS